MKITNIEVKNFKSFKEENINIGDFTILIGANASGKSNAISLIRFLSNILNYIKPDYVHILVDGKIVHSGDHTLASEIETSGYDKYIKSNDIVKE